MTIRECPDEGEPLLASANAVLGKGDSIVAKVDQNQHVRGLRLLSPRGVYRRTAGAWVPMAPDTDPEDDDHTIWDTSEDVVPLWDSAQGTGGTLTTNDL